MNYKIYPCKKCGKIELSRKNKSGFCRSCGLLGNKRGIGFRHTLTAKKRISFSKISEKNPNWKGDKVGIKALHIWVKKRIPKNLKCQNCRRNPSIDLANFGGYTRNLKNWKWLCRKCHMYLDGRIKNLKQFNGLS